MYYEALDVIPLWALVLLASILAITALEAGYRFGRWRHVRTAEEKEAPVGAMVGAVLGLLAFMLAFTFSLAATRFEARRQVLLEEANAVGTAYLRTSLLPQPQNKEAAALLREYVDVRIRGVQEGKIAEAINRSEELQKLLWRQATAAAQKNPGSIMTSLFIQSLNEVIDIHSKRVLVGARSRIPLAIWGGLFVLATIAMTSMGYQAGLSATRRSPAMLLLVLAFAGVFFLIAELDRAHEGLLKVNQQVMIDVQKTMQPPAP